ncbi:MAG: FabA/FabZ family ACP-dehydratase [Pseudomonadota bacterium]
MRFVLVDKVLGLEPGLRIETQFTFPHTAEIFLDHFPGFPVVPGVLLTECLAQAGARCLFAEDESRGWPMLINLKKVKFHAWVKPEQTITMRVAIGVSRSQYATASGECLVNDTVMVSAEWIYSFVEMSQLSSEFLDRIRADARS